MSEQAGRVIRGYELRERIGGGGFGEVYNAYQALLKREVAVKIILPQYANDPDFIRRFEVEAETVARLEHPFIVPLFDYWREPDGAYLVMRLLKGGSLEEHIEEMGALDLDTIIKYVDEITSGLYVAHIGHVVHRDIKPANILLDEYDNAYLVDFGIASDLSKTSTGQTTAMYTPQYASPEQIREQALSPQSDLYSLGLVIYEMLAGRPAFSGNLAEVVQAHLFNEVPSISDIRDDVPRSVDNVIRKATDKGAENRYETALDLAEAFRNALRSSSGVAIERPKPIISGMPTELADVLTTQASAENPYKGLRAFQEGDASDFFGREDLTERLVKRFDLNHGGARFLAVVGPSGSGKSSVVRAGMIPTLREGELTGSDKWFITDMFPSNAPMLELENALLKVAVSPPSDMREQLQRDASGLHRMLEKILQGDNPQLVLVIDQFEELFTQVEDEAERTHFIDSIINAITVPHPVLRVIVTIRADFYDRPLQYERLGEWMRQQTEVVLPLSASELERAIKGPADRAAVTLEPMLTQSVIDEVLGQPGTLPLLQYTLTELFDRRSGRLLTLKAYHEIGGVTGSLARRANELYEDLDADGQHAVRQLFLRLVTLGEGTEDTRRRVRRSEVATSDRVDQVIDIFGKGRLLTFDKDPISREPTIEVAHEALIRTWDLLRTWIDDSREDLRIQRRLSNATNEWVNANRDPSFLASGARLTQFEEWRGTTALALNDIERDYIETSLQLEAEKQAQQAAIARRVQNFQRASIVLGVMVVVAIVATGIFLQQANQARNSVAQSNQTLTPAQATVVAAGTLAEDSNVQVMTAQAQVDSVGATLTPAQATIAAAQADANDANQLAATAQEQVNVIGSTLTPVQGTVAAAQQSANAAILQASTAQAAADVAQTQVIAAGQTLTPVQATVAAGDALVATQQADLITAQALAGNAQTQAAVVQALTDIAPTVASAGEMVANLQAQVDSVGATLTPAQATVIAAQALVDNVGETLTPVGATVIAAQNEAANANSLAATAQSQVDNVGATLTPVQATVIAAQADADNANIFVATAQAQVNNVGATLTPVQETVVAAQNSAANANMLAATAQAQVDSVGATLTPVGATVIAAQNEAANANNLAATAQVQVANVGLTLTPVQATVIAAEAEADNANIFAQTAQAQVNTIGSTLTPVQQTVVAAQNSAANANILAATAQAQVDTVGETLTPVQGTVVAAQLEAENANIVAATAQALAGNAETQAANVRALTAIAPTLASAGEAVANLQAQVDNVGATLTPAQATIAAAQAQVANVGATLTPIQGTIVAALAAREEVQDEADAIRLAVAAEQAIGNFNYDLALALTIESLRLNPTLTRAKTIINNIAYGTARLSYNTDVWALSPDGQYFARAEGNDIVVVDVLNRREVDRLRGHVGQVLALDFNREGTQLASGSTDTTAILWDVSAWRSSGTASLQSTLAGHSAAVRVVKYSPRTDIPSVFTGSDDSDIIAWTTSNGSEIFRYTGNTWAVDTIEFVGSNGGNFFTQVDANGTPILLYWTITSSNPRFTEQSAIYSVYNDDATRGMLGGTASTPLTVYNTTQRTVVRQFTGNDFRWGNDIATAYDFRPGGREILVGIENADGNNRLILVDVATSAIVRQFSGEGTNRTDAIAFNQDGALALTANNNRLILWDVDRGTPLRTLASHPDVITDIWWSDDSTFAVSRSRNGNVRLWDIAGGDEALRQIIQVRTEIATGKYPGFNVSGSRVFSGVWVSLFGWDSATSEFLASTSTGDEVRGVIYSTTQSQALAILQRTTILYNLDNAPPTIIRNLDPGDATFSGIGAYSPDGNFVALDDTSRILIYDLARGSRVSTINKPRFENGHVITSLAITNDRQRVIATIGLPDSPDADAGDIIVWDITQTSGAELTRFPVEHTRTINFVTVSADGQLVLTASSDNTLMLWSIDGQLLRTFVGHSGDVTVGRILPDNATILSASADRTVILWDIQTGQLLRTFRGSPNAITGMNISVDGTQFVTAMGNELIFVWEITDIDDLISWTLNNRFIRSLTQAECDQFGVRNCAPSGSAVIPNTASVDAVRAPVVVPTAEASTATQADPTGEPQTVDVPENAPIAANRGGAGINVRASDTTSAGVVSTLQAGEEANVIGRSNRDTRWFQISLSDGRVGWVRNDVVSIEGDTSGVRDVTPPAVVVQPVAPAATTSSGGSEAPAPTSPPAASSANLQATGIGFQPDPPQCAQQFTVLVNLVNSGSTPTNAGGTIQIIDRRTADGSQQGSGSNTFPVLNPGQNWVVAVPITVSTFFAEQHQITAIVDVGSVVAETNEGDNQFSASYTLGSGSC